MYIFTEFYSLWRHSNCNSSQLNLVGLGQGLNSWSALNAIDRQPAARNDIIRVAIIGMTLVETVAILALLVSILLLINTSPLHLISLLIISEIGILLQ